MESSNPYYISKDLMRSLVEVLAPPERAQAFAIQVDDMVGPIEFEAYFNRKLLACVMLHGEDIDFVCCHGIHGCLYPDFRLDEYSINAIPGKSVIDEFTVLLTLRECFRTANEVYLSDDEDTLDEGIWQDDDNIG